MTDEQDFEDLKDDVDTLFRFLNSDIKIDDEDADIHDLFDDIDFNLRRLTGKISDLAEGNT